MTRPKCRVNPSDRDRPTCTSEAGRVAARRSPRSLNAIISNSTFGLAEKFPQFRENFAVILRGRIDIWQVAIHNS
jgi:hypothetical protein